MKLLGQLGFQDPRGGSSDGEAKPAYREQFLSPETSIVSHLMKKVTNSILFCKIYTAF